MTEYLSCPVAELVPHSPPMVLISRIVNYTENDLTAEVDISADSMFFDEDIAGVPAWVGLEYMAQTISAMAGVRAKIGNKDIQLGFLLGTRKYSMYEKIFCSGMTYQVYVKQLFRDESGLASFVCQIHHEDELICESKVNVFEAGNSELGKGRDDV